MRQVGGKVVGMIGWVAWDGARTSPYEVSCLMPSAHAPNGRDWMPVAFPNPLGREVEVPIGLVTSYAADRELQLTEIVRAVERFATRLETEVGAWCGCLDPPSAGPVRVTLSPGVY